MRNKLSGIYLIERIYDIDNGEPIYYIGQAKDLFNRLNEHASNSYSQEVDKAISKYGITSFNFKILKIENDQALKDGLEKEYIQQYIKEYGESKLYNRSDGGKKNQHLINQSRSVIDSEVKNNIINILTNCIDYSIYLLAEKFNLNFQEIIDIRKPLLKKNNLYYNIFKKAIVYLDTKEVPSQWRAFIITKKQFNIWENNKGVDKDQLSQLMNISLTDLKIFEKTYSENYIFADDIFKQ